MPVRARDRSPRRHAVAVNHTIAWVAVFLLCGCPEMAAVDAHPFDLSFNSWTQQRAWGPGEPCCDLEVAFLEVEEDDGFAAGDGCVIEVPDEPGACAISRFDRDEQQAQGCMHVQGSLSAGASVLMSDGERTFELVQDPPGGESVVYRIPTCPEAGHPEGVSLDLLVPGGEANDPVPGFALDDTLGVGPAFALVLPDPDGIETEMLPVPTDEDLELAWEHLSEIPWLSGGGLWRDTTVFIRNQEQDMFLFEALACRPDEEGALTIPADVLSQLTAPPGGEPGLYHTSLQIDVRYTSDGVPMPFGSISGVRSGVSLTGVIQLAEGGVEEEE